MIGLDLHPCAPSASPDTRAPRSAEPRAPDRTRRLAALLALSAIAACGAVDQVGPPADTVPDATDTAHDSGGDTTPVPVEFILGTHVSGASDPASFTPLGPGDSLEVELGFQGLWMVVLALKTRGLFTGPLLLDAGIVVDGVEQGTLALAEQQLAPGGDGYAYYYNFFLVVQDPAISGRPATIHFAARDDAGHERSVSLEVNLTGGT